jgi:hypothetical protein
MTGWRKGIGSPVHTHRECAWRSALTEVTLARTLKGELRLLDDLTKIPVTVTLCGRCARRDARANVSAIAG